MIMHNRLKFLIDAVGWPVVFLSPVLMSILVIGWLYMCEVVDRNTRTSFDTLVNHEVEVLSQRLTDYERVLLGASGLINASAAVTRDEWRIFYEALQLESSLPGIQGLGYSIPIPADELSTFENEIRAEGFPEFSVYPKGERDIYSAIVFIEPFEGRNLRAFGYDMYSEEVRNTAMNRAISTGLPSWSGKVTLVQETDKKVQAGLLVYFPIYVNGVSVRNETERLNAIKGFAYSAFRAEDMLSNLFRENGRIFEIKLYDQTVESENLIFSSGTVSKVPAFSNVQKLDIGGNQWVAVFESNTLFENSYDYSFPNLFLISGIFLGGLSIFSILVDRRKSARLSIVNEILKKKVNETKSIFELTELLQSCSNLMEAFLVISVEVPKIVPNTFGACYLFEDKSSLLEKKCSWGDHKEIITHFDSSECWAVKRSTLHRSSGTDFSKIYCNHLKDYAHPTVCVPMMSEGSLFGLLVISNDTQDGARFIEIANELYGSLAEIIGSKLANLQLQESLRQLSILDPLTGLYNRRFMEEYLDRETARAQRSSSTLAVALLDLDHFKKVNDTYGHQAGDLLLKKVSKILSSFRQGSDVACRYGGEEFLLVLTEINIEKLDRILETILERVRSIKIDCNGESFSGVTISIGVSIFPDDGEITAEIIRNADEALYNAKTRGRNCVVRYQDEAKARVQLTNEI